jgi:glycerophosphoryl diester phosphodiesterase
MKMRHLPVLPEFPRPLLFAHRGLNRKYLENSMESFEAAFNAGVPGIELDVHLTADDKLVIFHDDTTSRIEQKIQPEAPARNLELEASTFVELRSLFIGAHISLLDELFDCFGETLYYDIELKSRSTADTGLASKVASAIRSHNLESNCIISSFNPFALRHFIQAESAVPVGIIWSNSDELYWFLRHGEGALISKSDFLKPESSLFANMAGRPPLHLLPWFRGSKEKPIIPWTVNDPEKACYFIDQGATGVISDIADEILIRFRAEHEQAAAVDPSQKLSLKP